MKLQCYKVEPDPPRIVPGRVDRAWMDEHSSRFPYNCLPLNIANTSGWEILSPFGFTAEWDGGPGREAIQITLDEPRHHYFVESHFTQGVLTFNLGYLFRTEPGYDILVTGAPNTFKHGIQPMAGVIETDWLPYPFTMNWMFTAPGKVRWEKDEPVAFIRVQAHRDMDVVEPIILDLESNPELEAHHQAWRKVREDAAPAQHRCYLRGTPPVGGGPAPEDHVTKRRLKCPVTGEEA